MALPRVLHISTARSWRGGEQQIAYLSLELRKLGLEQHIVCIANAPLHQWALEHGFPVLPLPKASSIDLRFAFKIHRYHNKQNFDIWHAHDAHAHGFAVYAQHFFSSKCRLLVSRRVDFPVAKSLSSAFKYNHSAVYRYLCVSDAIANILRLSLKYPDKVYTVHSANDPSRFRNSKRGKLRKEFPDLANHFWVGNVAALTGHKDLFTFIDTARILIDQNSNFHFFLAGKGELESELKTYTEKLNLKKHISFLGFRPDIPEFLADLDCFLFTSEMEGLGTSILDAFASETPVVATKAGGIPELVIHEKTGLLYPTKSPIDLASGVFKIKEEPTLVSEIKANALEHLSNFSPENLARKTLDHYLS